MMACLPADDCLVSSGWGGIVIARAEVRVNKHKQVSAPAGSGTCRMVAKMPAAQFPA